MLKHGQLACLFYYMQLRYNFKNCQVTSFGGGRSKTDIFLGQIGIWQVSTSAQTFLNFLRRSNASFRFLVARTHDIQFYYKMKGNWLIDSHCPENENGVWFKAQILVQEETNHEKNQSVKTTVIIPRSMLLYGLCTRSEKTCEWLSPDMLRLKAKARGLAHIRRKLTKWRGRKDSAEVESTNRLQE